MAFKKDILYVLKYTILSKKNVLPPTLVQNLNKYSEQDRKFHRYENLTSDNPKLLYFLGTAEQDSHSYKQLQLRTLWKLPNPSYDPVTGLLDIDFVSSEPDTPTGLRG